MDKLTGKDVESLSTKTTEGEDDEVAAKHELFLREIEAIDEYWGPTFRSIYDGSEHSKFMERLDARIHHHDKEIERMCNHHYQGFIDSIRELLQLRPEASKLKTEVVKIDEAARSSAHNLLQKADELVKARKVQANIGVAIEALSACLPVLTMYSKLQKQIQERRFYPALKTLEQLEHMYLPRVASYRFAQQMRNNIPNMRENIKENSMSDIKDFLEAIRRVSGRIGQVAMKHAALQCNMDPSLAVPQSQQIAMPTANPFTGETYESSSEAESEEEELSAQDLINFAPVYRCLHIYTVLGIRDKFEMYYRQQRHEQARLALQPPPNMHESLEGYRQYMNSVVGFFVIEDHILNTGNGLVTRAYLDEVWEMAVGKVVNCIQNHSSYCTDTYMMLNIKNLIMLFAHTLQNYGYSVTLLHNLLLEIKDHYNEILMQKWVQKFREIFEEDNYHPIQVDTVEEYQRITDVFPFHDEELEGKPFPKPFPFSLMVPKVHRKVKNYIDACLEFSQDLNLSQREKEDMVRKSTNLLLTRTLSGCLATLIKRPSLGLLQLIQIMINTFHLEHANLMLENYVARLMGNADPSGSNPGLGRLQAKVMFKDIRGEAEEQIYTALRLKLDEFLELANYDWMMPESSGQPSSYVTDLVAFLHSTFAAFDNLPLRVAQTACMASCQHIARSLLEMLLSEDIKQMSAAVMEQINLDVIQCEQFAASDPVRDFEEGALLSCFLCLRQFLDLFMTDDWSTYFHDHGKENSKYLRVNPAQAIIIVEKLREGEKKGVFSILKRSDKKKLLETVLKQLKQLMAHNQMSSHNS